MFNKLLRKQKAELERQIEEKQAKLDSIYTQISNTDTRLRDARIKLSTLSQEVALKESTLKQLEKEVNMANGIITMEDMGIEYHAKYNSLSETESKRHMIETDIQRLLGYDEVVMTTRVYTIDESHSKGEKFQKNYCENVLIGFNSYFTKKMKSVNAKNYNKTCELITKKFNQFNKKTDLLGVAINKRYLDLVLQLVEIELEEKILKAEEKARVREERRRLREQEQLLAEAERERKKLEEERHNLQKLFAKAVTEAEQNEIQSKLAEVDKRVDEVDWRVSHYSAGWLYITTTPAMPGIYKAGCTKQLNPLNRLAQLSSASVPFPFECRALVFSDDVFALEAKLHNRLDDKRVNKENKLKEFFFGEPEEAIKILTDEFHEEVRFIDEQWIDGEREE